MLFFISGCPRYCLAELDAGIICRGYETNLRVTGGRGKRAMEIDVLLKLIHLIGASVLFGTGAGIAFFMYWADRSGDVQTIASTARIVVVADFIFTATAVVLQPLTGLGLAHVKGYDFFEPWILASLGLYLLIGVCWIPVIFLQITMRNEAEYARDKMLPLSGKYHRAMRRWFWLGIPAFFGTIAIFWLMIARPALF